jgi:hypothetical protein
MTRIDDVVGDAPVVRINPLHMAGAAQRFQSAHVEADEDLRVFAEPLEAVTDKLDMPARLVDAGAVSATMRCCDPTASGRRRR